MKFSIAAQPEKSTKKCDLRGKGNNGDISQAKRVLVWDIHTRKMLEIRNGEGSV